MTTEVLGAQDPTNWIPSDESFAARLALVRWRMGWNIKEAALACGVPAASWRLWELENAQPRRLVEVAGRISERTGCDYGWLLAGNRLRSTPGAVRLTYPSGCRTIGLRPPGWTADRQYPLLAPVSLGRLVTSAA